MKLFSHDLRDGEKLPHHHVFNGMGYNGDNISPQQAWEHVPAGTKSVVVTCFDPDALTGSGGWHWIDANLPADTRELPQGAGSGLAARRAAEPSRLQQSGLEVRSSRRSIPWLSKQSLWIAIAGGANGGVGTFPLSAHLLTGDTINCGSHSFALRPPKIRWVWQSISPDVTRRPPDPPPYRWR